MLWVYNGSKKDFCTKVIFIYTVLLYIINFQDLPYGNTNLRLLMTALSLLSNVWNIYKHRPLLKIPLRKGFFFSERFSNVCFVKERVFWYKIVSFISFILYFCVDLKPHNAGPFDTDNVLWDTENATENATVFIILILRYLFFYNQSGC